MRRRTKSAAPRRNQLAGRRPRRSRGLLPGRALRTVGNEPGDEVGRSGDKRLGPVEEGKGKRRGRRRNRADTECRAGAARRVRKLAGVCIRRPFALVSIGHRGDRIHPVHTVVSMRVGAGGLRGVAGHLYRAGMLLNTRARHIDGRSHRMQRKRGHQKPDQQCREQAVHSAASIARQFWRCDGHALDFSDCAGSLPNPLDLASVGSSTVGRSLFARSIMYQPEAARERIAARRRAPERRRNLLSQREHLLAAAAASAVVAYPDRWRASAASCLSCRDGRAKEGDDA